MPLAAKALVTLDEAKSWLGITGATDDAKLEEEINRAAELIEGYCDRPLKRTPDLDPVTIRRSSLGGRLFPIAAAPVDTTKAVTVAIDGVAQTVWRADGDGEPADKDVVVGYVDGASCELEAVFHPGKPERSLFRPDVLYRAAGWSASKLGGIVISYSGGLATVPHDLKEAGLYVVQKLWRDRTKGTADVSSIAMPAGSVVTTDVAAIMFNRTLPSVVRLILDRYRRVALA